MDRFIADIHFGHASAIEFDGRPFNSVEEMDDEIIQSWNKEVSYDDDVWIVGDMFFHNAEPPEWYLKQLRGRLHLIVGNHDVTLLKNKKAMSYFNTVDKATVLNLNGQMVHVSHFPMAEWNGMYHGWWHIYGHLHNQMNDAQQFMLKKERALNAGACILGYVPQGFNNLIEMNRKWRAELSKQYDNIAEII